MFFLILSFCQGFWHEGANGLSRLEIRDSLAINCVTPLEPAFCVPRSTHVSARSFPATERPAKPFFRYQLERIRQLSRESYLAVRGQGIRNDDFTSLSEWGLTVLQYPRSDG